LYREEIMKWLSKKLVRFISVDDFIEHVRNRGSLKEKHQILTQAVKRLFNTISADDILKETEQGMMFEGKVLVKAEADAIREHAVVFRDSKLYKILIKDIKYQANRRMFIDSKTEMDMIAGKLILFNEDIIKTRLKKF